MAKSDEVHKLKKSEKKITIMSDSSNEYLQHVWIQRGGGGGGAGDPPPPLGNYKKYRVP